MTLSLRRVWAVVLASTIIGIGCGSSSPETGECPAGQLLCQAACADPQSSFHNCGACGNTCGGDEVCSQGVCMPRCAQGLVECGGACVDAQTSPEHCGACGNACSQGRMCQAGSCVLPCPAGQEECAGSCVDPQTSAQHCGSCGFACVSGQVCRAGSCETPCPQGQVECGGSCVDTRSDPQNCGGCDAPCGPGRVCSAGTCGGCQSGLSSCGQSCVDTSNDPTNCGGCGNVCGTGQTCIQGGCKAASSCTSSLLSARADAWGASWDGLERVANTYAAAKQGCESFGGRLPSASELYRVNSTRSGNIGASSTNFLWSLAPNNPTSQHTVRLSDGGTSAASNNTSTKVPYRCVCAPSTPAFIGNACFGPQGQACFALKAGGNRYNIDVMDRPALSKNAAVWECAFNRAHLADYATYASAIVAGLPNGSKIWLHTADDARSSKDTLIQWTGTQPSWPANGNTTASTLTTSRPFRCAGVNFAAGTHPNTVTGEYVGPLGGYKGEGSNPAQASWEQAHDECWNRGGHLPRSTELAELVQQGLPNGDGSWLWTADQAGYNGTQFLAMTLKWSGKNTAFGYSNPDFISAVYKLASPVPVRPFRCIYYPLDPQYSGPTAQDCQGGCMRFQLPGSTPAVMWMDKLDRANSTLETAVAACAAAGGRLSSARDYTEAIRHGLPNGSGKNLLSSDLTYDDVSTTSPGPRVIIPKWTGVNTSFNDQYPTYTTWSSLPTPTSSPRPYRCVWTNELR